jgi:hypothetical protein
LAAVFGFIDDLAAEARAELAEGQREPAKTGRKKAA